MALQCSRAATMAMQEERLAQECVKLYFALYAESIFIRCRVFGLIKPFGLPIPGVRLTMLIVIVLQWHLWPALYNEDISRRSFFENCDKVDNDNEGSMEQIYGARPATDIYDYF